MQRDNDLDDDADVCRHCFGKGHFFGVTRGLSADLGQEIQAAFNAVALDECFQRLGATLCKAIVSTSDRLALFGNAIIRTVSYRSSDGTRRCLAQLHVAVVGRGENI